MTVTRSATWMTFLLAALTAACAKRHATRGPNFDPASYKSSAHVTSECPATGTWQAQNGLWAQVTPVDGKSVAVQFSDEQGAHIVDGATHSANGVTYKAYCSKGALVYTGGVGNVKTSKKLVTTDSNTGSFKTDAGDFPVTRSTSPN